MITGSLVNIKEFV